MSIKKNKVKPVLTSSEKKTSTSVESTRKKVTDATGYEVYMKTGNGKYKR